MSSASVFSTKVFLGRLVSTWVLDVFACYVWTTRFFLFSNEFVYFRQCHFFLSLKHPQNNSTCVFCSVFVVCCWGQWVGYFMHQNWICQTNIICVFLYYILHQNWICQTNAYLVWHLGIGPTSCCHLPFFSSFGHNTAPCVFVYLCICIFVYLYICVFVYLCMCVCVFAYLCTCVFGISTTMCCHPSLLLQF